MIIIRGFLLARFTLEFKTELTKEIFKSKYLLEGETETSQAVDRIVSVVADYYPEYAETIRHYINKRWLLPAGSLWRAARNPNKNVSVVNCTTLLQPNDSLEDIFESYYWWAKYSAFGQGEGVDLSLLRPRGAIVHNSSHSSTGAVSFMHIYNGILEIIAQQGRRGATLISLRIEHPDIPEFIHVKEEEGILSNSNISIQITNRFMESVEKNEDWTFRFKNKYETIEKTVNAADLFTEICTQAWKSGDPGLLFIDTAKKYSNSDYLGMPVISTNACCLASDTLITTKEGLFPIADLIGKEVEIFDGKNWVFNNGFEKMGENQDIYRVTLHSGLYFDVTKDHRFYLEDGGIKNTQLLQKGDRLEYNTDEIIQDIEKQNKISGAYLKGFLLGDGSVRRDARGNINPMLYLYEPKYMCADSLEESANEIKLTELNTNAISDISWYKHDMHKNRKVLKGLTGRQRNSLYHWAFTYKQTLPKEVFTWDMFSKKQLIAGLFDADGCALKSSKGFGYQLASIHKEFLIDILKLLATMGIYGKLSLEHKKRITKIKGINYECKEIWRITIPQKYAIKMAKKIQFNRLEDLSDRKIKRQIRFLYNKVVSIEKLPEKSDVYCTTVPTTSKFLINGGIITGNSEQWLDPNNVCLLSSINIAPYQKDYGIEIYQDLINKGIILLDAFRNYEYAENRSPSRLQRQKLIDMPRIGLGVTGLADYFINQKIPYAHIETYEHIREIFGTLARESYYQSYIIACKHGSFPLYDKTKYMKSPYIQRLLKEGWIEKEWLDHQAHVCKVTLAPNGTLTEIAEVGGSGVEPMYARYYVRRERSTKQGEWTEWFIFNHAVRNYLEEQGLEVNKENTDKLIEDYWVTAHSLDYNAKIEMLSIIQKYIDSSISVTFNLRNDATVQDVKNIYMEAWKAELKGVTVFRDGCKPGILITEENYNDTLETKILTNRFSSERPDVIECDIYHRIVNKEKHIVLVGLVEDKPYEIFVTNDPENQIDLSSHKRGYIVKIKKGHYDLQIENGGEKTILENISEVFDKEYGSLSRMISMSLRHKVPIPFICDQLAKDKQFDSFEKAVSRTLKNYIEENREVLTSDSHCPECGETLVYQGGCKTCVNQKCAWSKCD